MKPLVILTEGGSNFLMILVFLAVCLWIWKCYQIKIEWFSQHIAPENPRTDRNISEDVLVYDYDNDCNLVAYYCYSSSQWKFINWDMKVPDKFKWRYFDIDR